VLAEFLLVVEDSLCVYLFVLPNDILTFVAGCFRHS
jgi:hypothetical protein